MDEMLELVSLRLMEKICVFCGSSVGEGEVFSQAARLLADRLLAHNIELVYGGGNIGLMGVMADHMLSKGGRVTGVIPDFLVRKEVVHQSLSELHVVQTMHERKIKMAEISDAFITMPGGFGTLDEMFEVLTWNQLGVLEKPMGILNVEGFFNPLIEMIDRMTKKRFLRVEHHDALLVDNDPEQLIQSLKQHRFPAIDGKWIDDLKMTSRY